MAQLPATKSQTLVLAASFLALLGASGCRSKSTLTAQQAEGKQIYEVGCAHCHQDNNLGLRPAPPDLHGVFNHSTLPGGEPATDAEVERILQTGKGMMPSFAFQLTPEQTAALLAYLHTGMVNSSSQNP